MIAWDVEIQSFEPTVPQRVAATLVSIRGAIKAARSPYNSPATRDQALVRALDLIDKVHGDVIEHWINRPTNLERIDGDDGEGGAAPVRDER